MNAAVQFSAQQFREEREAEWRDLEYLLTRLENGDVRSLAEDDLRRLPGLYRAALSSLSLARATSLDAALLSYLEALALRCYLVMYAVHASPLARLKHYFLDAWPAAVRAQKWHTLAITLLFMVAAILSYVAVRHDPAWFATFIDPGLAQGRTPDASAEALRQTLTEQPGGLHIFATMLFTNNSQVAILAYALGIGFGMPTLMLIVFNALPLGALMAVFVGQGLGADFGGWLAIHGTTELFAIFLAGGAGLRIGAAFAFPGQLDRLDAAMMVGRQSALVMMGVVIMLLVAGLLEGFGRQMIGDTGARYAIGLAMLCFWIAYFYAPRPQHWRSGAGLRAGVRHRRAARG